MHTDQCLNFESNQSLDHKLSVVRMLHHRAESVVSDPEDVRQEKTNINKALHACGYPTWAIHKALQPRRPRENCETALQGASVAITTSVSIYHM